LCAILKNICHDANVFFPYSIIFIRQQQENTIPINGKVTSKKFDLESFKKKAKLEKAMIDAKFVYMGECEFIENDSLYKWEELKGLYYEEVKVAGSNFKKVSSYKEGTLSIII
jgi:hypothetical protein